jgi:hypothetical protein
VRISAIGKNRQFSAVTSLEKRSGSGFYPEAARSKTKSGNSHWQIAGTLLRLVTASLAPLLEGIGEFGASRVSLRFIAEAGEESNVPTPRFLRSTAARFPARSAPAR